MLTGTGCTGEKGSTVSDMKELQGRWQLVYQEVNGEKLPDEVASRTFHGKMVFVGNKIHYSVDLPSFDFDFTYQLHPELDPKAIDLWIARAPDKQGVGQQLHGVYLLKDDTLKICHAKTARPLGFDARKGSHNVLIVLKRENQ